MADSIYTFDPVAANNTSLDTIPYGPNQLYHNQIDNWFRALAAKLAQRVDDLGGVNTVGGTANAITVTLASGITAYATGQLFWFKNTPGPNTAATTMNVNAIGDKEIRLQGDTALSGGEMLDNGYYGLLYDAAYDGAAGGFVLLNPATSSVDAATTSAAGIVELTTPTEAATLTDTSRAVTADSLVFLGGYTTTATAAGTTTLTVTSTYNQYFTGSTTQTLVLPVTSTLVLGRSFRVVNNSTGAVTVQSSGANTILILAAGASALFTVILTSGTDAASWSYRPLGVTLGTAVASTSGTAIDFTGIPAWAKRITIVIAATSTNGSSPPLVQIGDSGGIENTGYVSTITEAASSVTTSTSTVGFRLAVSWASSSVLYATIILTLENASTNAWAAACLGVVGGNTEYGGGYKAISAVLDRVRVTPTNGTDTFDAGEINISWE